LTLLALLASWAAGCDLPGRPGTGDRYVPPQKENRFDVLFQRNCVGCHGTDGKLGPAPPLNDKLFLAQIPDTELERVITEGRSGTLMPAFATAKGGPLTTEQIKILADDIKPRWGPVEPVPSGAPPYLLAQSPSERAVTGNQEAGLKVFARACAACHGDHGQGAVYQGKSVGAINDPDFLALASDQSLRRYVITGRPDLGMPDYADPMGRPKGFQPLTGEDVTNLAVLLAAWRRGGSVQRKGD
jgi:cytochrome c oxidase cbb3-type subunit 3/ubiquinol-cytochrome c reductase cytochrome c subunit